MESSTGSDAKSSSEHANGPSTKHTPVHALVKHMQETIKHYKRVFGSAKEGAAEGDEASMEFISGEDKRAETSLAIYAEILEKSSPQEVESMHMSMFLDAFEPHKFMFIGIMRKLREYLTDLNEKGFSKWKTRAGPSPGPGLQLGENLGLASGVCVPIGPIARMANDLYNNHELKLASGSGEYKPDDPEHVLIHSMCIDVLGIIRTTVSGEDLEDCDGTIDYFMKEYVLHIEEDEGKERLEAVKGVMQSLDIKSIMSGFGFEMPEGADMDAGGLVDQLFGSDSIDGIAKAMERGDDLSGVIEAQMSSMKEKMDGLSLGGKKYSDEDEDYASGEFSSDYSSASEEEVVELVPVDEVD